MKANIPSRIAFAVASAMESRIILDTAGAEKLVGRGDMLYAPLGEGKPKRVQGCFISSEEIERVVNFVKENGETDYDESVIDKINAAVAEKEKGSGKGGRQGRARAERRRRGGRAAPRRDRRGHGDGTGVRLDAPEKTKARLFARGAHRRRDGDARHRGPSSRARSPASCLSPRSSGRSSR